VNQTDALRNFAAQQAGVTLDRPATLAQPAARPPMTSVTIAATGEQYYPGHIEGMTDIDLLANARQYGLFVRLLSDPGCGKSRMVMAAFGSELITQVFSEGTAEEDVIGGWTPTDTAGRFEFRDGPLTRAMREGRPWLGDEINAANPRVLTALNGVFDGRLELRLPTGELVKAADGFYAVVAYNHHAAGFELSQAMRSRFVLRVEVRSNLDAAKEIGVSSGLLATATRMRTLYEQHLRSYDGLRDDPEAGEEPSPWMPQMRELVASRQITEAFGERVAARNLLGIASEEGAYPQLLAALTNAIGEGLSQPLVIE